MIITLIVIALLIIGIVCAIIGRKSYSAIPEVAGLVLITISVLASLFAIGFIIDANVNKDVDYQNKLYEKEVLEHRIDNMSENIVGNELLYNDIVEFNNELRNTKKWANNPWTNWFNNEKIASIDYIEIPDLNCAGEQCK